MSIKPASNNAEPLVHSEIEETDVLPLNFITACPKTKLASSMKNASVNKRLFANGLVRVLANENRAMARFQVEMSLLN